MHSSASDHSLDKALLLLVAAGCMSFWLHLRADPPWNNVLGEFTDEANYTGNVQSCVKLGKWSVNWLDNVWACPLYQGALLFVARLVGKADYLSLRIVASGLATVLLAAFALIARRCFGSRGAIWAVALMAANSVFLALYRNFGAETGVVLCLLSGYWFLSGRGIANYALAGLLFCLAIGMKLSGVYGIAGAGIFVLWGLMRRRIGVREAIAIAAPLALGAGVAMLAWSVKRGDWEINFQLQRLISKRTALSLGERFIRVIVNCHLLRDPGFWIPFALTCLWLPDWLVRRLPAIWKGQCDERSELLTFAMLLESAGVVVMCLLNPENVIRRMVFLLVPMCLLFPRCFEREGDESSPGRLGWSVVACMAVYSGLLAIWSFRCYADYFMLSRAWVSKTEFKGGIAISPFWAILPALCLLLSFGRGRKNVRRGVTGAAIVLFASWSCLTTGRYIMRPTFTVVEAGRSLREFVRRGDCMWFNLEEGNQGFVLSLENDAVPMFILPNSSLEFQRTDRSVTPRLLSRTVGRYTTWQWGQWKERKPPPAPIETELRLIRLVPNPMGVPSHEVAVEVLRRP